MKVTATGTTIIEAGGRREEAKSLGEEQITNALIRALKPNKRGACFLTDERGRPVRGLVRCSVAPAYDTALIVMTGAFAVEAQWSGYSSWLPLAAEQISAIDGAAFGRRGIMAQNLRLSKEYGEATSAYREWSQRNWNQVTEQRGASDDRRNEAVRENLGSTRAYTNPYDTSVPVDLPLTYKYYWVNRQGTYVGTNDPSVNLNYGSTDEWKQMPQTKR